MSTLVLLIQISSVKRIQDNIKELKNKDVVMHLNIVLDAFKDLKSFIYKRNHVSLFDRCSQVNLSFWKSCKLINKEEKKKFNSFLSGSPSSPKICRLVLSINCAESLTIQLVEEGQVLSVILLLVGEEMVKIRGLF